MSEIFLLFARVGETKYSQTAGYSATYGIVKQKLGAAPLPPFAFLPVILRPKSAKMLTEILAAQAINQSVRIT